MDERIRNALAGPLDRLAGAAVRVGIGPHALTVTGLVLGLGAAVAAGLGAWLPAFVLWLVSRLPDGLDGAVARRTGTDSELGGFLDIVADFSVYGAFVLGVGVAAPSARVACLALLLAYYVNGSAFLAISGLAERRARRVVDGERSLQFVGGLTEGFETIVAHALFALCGAFALGALPVVVWVFTAMVAVTVLQRLRFGIAVLRD